MPCELCGVWRHTMHLCDSPRKAVIVAEMELKLVGTREAMKARLMGEPKLKLKVSANHHSLRISGNKADLTYRLVAFAFARDMNASYEREREQQQTQSQLNREAFQRRVQEQQQELFRNYQMTAPPEYLRTNPFAGLPPVAPVRPFAPPPPQPPSGRQIQLSCSNCVMADDKCAICFEKTYIQTQCGHSFCHCIVQYIGKKAKVDCPLCRTEIIQLEFNQPLYYNVLKSTAGMLPIGRFHFDAR